MGMEAQPFHQNVVVNVQYVTPPFFGDIPVTLTCGNCQNMITTRTEKKMSHRGRVMFMVLCVAGCWPCCLIPFCLDSMQAVKLYALNMNGFKELFYRQLIHAQAATLLLASTIQARWKSSISKQTPFYLCHVHIW